MPRCRSVSCESLASAIAARIRFLRTNEPVFRHYEVSKYELPRPRVRSLKSSVKSIFRRKKYCQLLPKVIAFSLKTITYLDNRRFGEIVEKFGNASNRHFDTFVVRCTINSTVATTTCSHTHEICSAFCTVLKCRKYTIHIGYAVSTSV